MIPVFTSCCHLLKYDLFLHMYGNQELRSFCMYMCIFLWPPIPLIHSKNQYSVMKKRDLSAMKERDLKFNQIISPFLWQIVEIEQCYMYSVICSYIFCHLQSFCREMQIQSEVCVEVEKKCAFSPLQHFFLLSRLVYFKKSTAI